MQKPWLSEPGGPSLQGILGVYGVQTSDFEKTVDLIRYAAAIFEIPTQANCSAMATAIKAIPKKSRSTLARKNLGNGKEPPKPVIEALTPRHETLTAVDDRPIEARLLHQVVMAVINAGQADILKELPEVNAFYNCQLPTVADVIGGRAETAIVTGDISFDDKVYSFRCARTVRR